MFDEEILLNSKIFVLKGIFVFFAFLGLFFFVGTPKGFAGREVMSTFLANGGFGDSKFISHPDGPPSIVTSRLGKLFWVDLPENLKYRAILKPLLIDGDWFAVEQSNGESCFILTSSQNQRSLRLYSIERAEDRSAHLLKVIVANDSLKIDPTLRHLNEMWYLTFTQVEGVANRSTEDTPNGKYTIQVMSSRDLQNWDGPYTVVQKYFNLEDPILFYNSDTKRLTLLYEQETIDRHDSTLSFISSGDFGRTWGDERTLDLPRGDKEPAGIVLMGQQYRLFFSSDAENPGSSYEGAHAYQILFPQPNEAPSLVQLPQIEGSLLLDSELVDNTLHLIGIEKYRTERQLFWYQVPAKSLI
jgi:hypothetical protein